MVHVIKTSDLKSDGRLLKWLDSLDSKSYSCSVFLLADRNEKGIYQTGAYKITESRLFSRKIFKKRKGYLFKVPEYAFRFLRFILKSTEQVFVFHDGQQYLNILLTILGNNIFWKKKIVWDLHELPHSVFLKTIATRRLLSYILSSVDLIIYTNEDRRDYILQNYDYSENEFVVLNNYPNRTYFEESKSELPLDLKKWLEVDELPYILWMGVASEGRNFGPVLSAFNEIKSRFKLVIMGKVSSEFENEINEYIKQGYIFSKFVPQEEIISYVDNASFSVVLYKSDTPNNYLCEPNRLYQLIGRNIPVIGGNNPTIVRNINEFGNGIILNDDGSSSDEMTKAFQLMLDRIADFKKGMENNEKLLEMTWDMQFKEVIRELKKLTSSVQKEK